MGLLIVYALLVFDLCRRVVTFNDVPWLKVETQESAYAGNAFAVRVTLREPAEGVFLRVDLHGIDVDGKTLGYHSRGKTQPIVEGTRVYDFQCPVHDDPSTAMVFPVVYLTRDGSWAKRIRVANATAAPVVRTFGAPEISRLYRVGVRDPSREAHVVQPEAKPLSWLVAGLWFSVAVLGVTSSSSRHARLFALAAAMAGTWELLAASERLAAVLRAAASAYGWYLDRRGPQGLLTLVAMLAMLVAGVAPVLFLRSFRRTVLWLSMLTFWGLAVLRLLSFHELDAVLSQSIFGLQVGQLARAASACGCLIVVLLDKKTGRSANSC